MTTSPPPPPAVAAASTKTQEIAAVSTLSEERASTIGWFFISSYYKFYNSNIENIYKIYHANASLTHASFPTTEKDEENSNTVHKAQGIESIKGRFKNDAKLTSLNNRIVITSAVFEISLNKNILIVVFGEWARDDSPYHQFTQTFVLTPGKTENTFDVANDILKFIDFNEFKYDDSTSSGPNSASTLVESSIEESKEVTEVKKDEVEASEETTAVTTPEVKQEVEEPEEEQQEEEQSAVPTQEVEVESKDEEVVAVEATEAEVQAEVETEEKPPVSNEPLSWAALASQSAPKPKAVTPTTKASTATSTISSTATATAAASTTTAKKTVVTPVAQANGKFKKEEWFPIYIRGVLDIDERKLREHISQTFGELKFFRLSSNIALCDFVTIEAQQKALEAKETVIEGVKISLEPRESKTGNNFHNGKKAKDQKDKTGSSPTGGDSKKKNDKKNSSSSTNGTNNANNNNNNKKKNGKPTARTD
ncbi:hypothetical protein DFJ63DRAFT_328413 [Scheffersomyces coipomensis]|uniref:uncharacterized protein n=1 Tax=Scheffersomyces coipomensis TaxID=1788519 RepID=UPI00315C5B13